MSAFGFLRLEPVGDATRITLLGHVLHVAVLRELEEALAMAGPRVLITGTEGYFAAGADIAELNAIEGAGAFGFARSGQSILNGMTQDGRRSAAAIDGFCLGGGLDLALACAFRYATPRSMFAHPGGRIGILTGWGGTGRLPGLIGRSRALEMMIAGQWLTATEAADWGLIDGIVDDPVQYALTDRLQEERAER